RVAPEDAARIVEAVGGGHPVAVMVGVTPAEALDLARRARAERVQLHRVDPAGWPDDFPLACTFAMGVTPEGGIVGREPASNHLLLLDTASGPLAGGTGRTWPWEVARAVVARRAVMLAGGLDPDNVAEAVRALRPFGVDASSRLETAPGCKDPDRVRRFVEAVRACDTRTEDA
ncbi:MAG: phosphoribosylanthranilate isomerase, partial [bacterium]